jgi:putative FmdB family regulatory protein
MPIHDYACRACDARFELLVRASTTPACPACRSEDLERLLSLPAIRSDSTRDVVRRETTRRDATEARDRVNEQRRYERTHD